MSAQRLGMDMTGLLSLTVNLSGPERQLVQGALSHLDHIITGLLPKREVENKPQQEQQPKRAHGEIKL